MITSSQFTLYVSGTVYDLQTRLTLAEGNFRAVDHEIVAIPLVEDGTLHIKLIVEPGGNMEEAIHDFQIGEFPPSILSWELFIEVYDMTELKHGEVRTAQEEGEALPRPIVTGILR